jgi:hypothetical protein
MKKLVMGFLLGLLWWPSSMHAKRIHWYGDYDQALHAARNQHRDLLVILVQPRSAAAAKLIQAIQKDARLSASIVSNFTAVIITVDHRTQYPNEMYYVPRFPALFVVDTALEISRVPPCIGQGVLGCLRMKLADWNQTKQD